MVKILIFFGTTVVPMTALAPASAVLALALRFWPPRLRFWPPRLPPRFLVALLWSRAKYLKMDAGLQLLVANLLSWLAFTALSLSVWFLSRSARRLAILRLLLAMAARVSGLAEG